MDIVRALIRGFRDRNCRPRGALADAPSERATRDRLPARAMGRSAQRDEAIAEASFARYMKPVGAGRPVLPSEPTRRRGCSVFERALVGLGRADPLPDTRERPSRNQLTPALLPHRAGSHLQFSEGPIRAERACPPSRRASAALPPASSVGRVGSSRRSPRRRAVRDADRSAPSRPRSRYS